MDYFLGVDIGTGSCKAVAVDTKGAVLCSAQEHYPMLKNPNNYAEQDPLAIWNAFSTVVESAVDEMDRSPVCVSLSSVMHSLVVINKNHEPVTNLITWADNRAEEEAVELRQADFAAALYASSGTPIHSMTPLCKILWLKKNSPAAFANAFKFLSIKDFIWYRLFNEYQTEESLATGTGLFNIETRGWNRFALELAGIREDQLPALVKTTYTRNDLQISLKNQLVLENQVLFCIGATDGCLANLGSFATEESVAAVTIGTSGAVRVCSPKPVIDFESMIFNYVLDEKTFVCGGPVNNGGNVLQWLAKNLLDKKIENDYEEIFDLIETVPPGAGGLLFLPYLQGERAPIWDERSSGMYVGLKSFHTKAHMLRAAIEGMCFNLKIILENLERLTGRIDQLNASGGFTKEIYWVQMLADITGKNIVVTNREDASAIGAAMLGMQALGTEVNFELADEDDRHITPAAGAHSTYESLFRIFRNLYSTVKPEMHQLSALNYPV